jgi:hypothetical protein
MTTQLTPEQIETVIEWMNEWEQLKNTVIPIRFKEDFMKKLTKDFEVKIRSEDIYLQQIRSNKKQ